MNYLQLSEILKENNLDDIEKLSSFVFHQLDAKTRVDYCYFNEIDLQDSTDDNESSEVGVEGCNFDDDDDDTPDDYHSQVTSKETFHGMKIFDKIDPTKKNNYFRIIINKKIKYLHKQTAARRLTTGKNCFSSDRLTRVQQTNKQK